MFPPAFTSTVLEWGDEVRRDFPWRHTRDPWRVLVSELMLQQTQAARVVPRYLDFVAAYPTPAACAAAPRAEVIGAWEGLGYNRRAVHLHEAANLMVAEHDGVVPGDLDALLRLPGVGPYTARAVLTFAHEADVGVVDVNVGRLLARWLQRPLSPRDAQAMADALVPPGRSWRWNQTMFDLGATICTARDPGCAVCPVTEWCAWRGEGSDPARGSAATSRPQSTFAGSDRQGRGRLVDALRIGPVEIDAIAGAMGWPDDRARAERVAATLVADGLAVVADGRYVLPE